MKIIVSHPGKQHSYKLVKALSELGHDVKFCTSIAYPIDSKKLVKKIFRKRLIDSPNIKIKRFFAVEIFRLILRKLITPIKAQHYFERVFDFLASKWLKRQEFDIFIGYECSSRYCFEVCKEKSKISILDLAQIHYKELYLLGQKYDCLAYLSQESITRRRINKTKELELTLCDYILSISTLVKESLIKHQNFNGKILDLPIGNNKIPLKHPKKKSSFFKIIYVGTIRDQKGVKLLIDSIDDLKNESIKLTIIGQINEPHYQTIISKRNYINHIPYIPNEELCKYYQESDLFVLPSYLDSWGMVTLEAMSNSLPVIITENCGSKDAVKLGGGIVINAGSKSELINAINDLCQNKELCLEMSYKAQETALSYSEASYKEKLKKILDGLKYN